MPLFSRSSRSSQKSKSESQNSRNDSSDSILKSGRRHKGDSGDGGGLHLTGQQSSLAPPQSARFTVGVRRMWERVTGTASDSDQRAPEARDDSMPLPHNPQNGNSQSQSGAMAVEAGPSRNVLPVTDSNINVNTQDIAHSPSIQDTSGTVKGGNQDLAIVIHPPSSGETPPAEPVIHDQLPTPDVSTGTQSHSAQSLPMQKQATSDICPPNAKGVISTHIPDESPSLWKCTMEIADTLLRDHDLPPFDWNTLSSATTPGENIQSVIQTLKTTPQVNDEKQRLGRERLRRILRGVEKYTKIVDTAVQHSPEVTALVWAGVRGILQISLNHLETTEFLEETMTTIMMKVTMCEFYAGIYAGVTGSIPKTLRDALHTALPQLYASVIVFSVKTEKYFHARWVARIQFLIKPFEIEFGPFIDEINTKEKIIRECADRVTMNRIRDMESQISDIKSEIQKLNEEMAPKVDETLSMTKQLFDDGLLKMLSPLEPLKRHDDIKSLRIDGTGSWLLQLHSFRNWSNNSHVEQPKRVFCCYGIPGAGKTIMSSIVYDDLCSRFVQSSTLQTGIACLYSDYRDQNAQTLVHILGSLLQQLLRTALLSIPQTMRDNLQSKMKDNRTLDKNELVNHLGTTLQQLERAFICIDALDELEAKTRKELLQTISHLVASNDNVRVFLTGRKHIRTELQDLSEISADITAHSDDIRLYLKKQIAEDDNPDAMDDALENDIKTLLVERSQEMFLLPALHIKMVLEMTTKAKRRKALQTLPTGIFDTFSAIIARIQSLSPSKAELGMQVLMWLHGAYRPFELEELQHALSVEPEQLKLDLDNIPSLKVILDSCLGLIIHDEETKTIRFVHYTLEEYFRNHSAIYFPDSYSTAAKMCLTYLSFGQVVPPCKTMNELRQRITDFPFLKYAARYWGNYVAQQCNDVVKELALRILSPVGETSCSQQVLYSQLRDILGQYTLSDTRSKEVVVKFSGVHVAAYFGLAEFLQCLYSAQGCVSLDMQDDLGRTPLSHAAERGHDAVVLLLLERNDVDVNKPDWGGYTSLSKAALNGHEAVVRLLLERNDVNVNKPDWRGYTPLSKAALNGHEAVVRLLLERNDVNVNERDITIGNTPLLNAAWNGHEAVVRLLLERNDVDINKPNRRGNTILSEAALKGHEAVVRLLLERNDVDVAAVNKYGKTAADVAEESGYDSIATLLRSKRIST